MVCADCRPPGSATPSMAAIALLAALLSGDWEVADASEVRERREASGLVAAFLQWHLERQLRTLPLVERIRPGDPMDRIDRSVLDRRVALVRQDVAHGDEPGEPLRAEG